MIMPLSATKPRKKSAICKYWNGKKPRVLYWVRILQRKKIQDVVHVVNLITVTVYVRRCRNAIA